MPFFVYILYSERFDKYYIGQTNSIESRLERHNEFDNTNSFTSKYRPWKLAAWANVGMSRSEAIKVERKIKALKSRRMIARFASNPETFQQFCNTILTTEE